MLRTLQISFHSVLWLVAAYMPSHAQIVFNDSKFIYGSTSENLNLLLPSGSSPGPAISIDMPAAFNASASKEIESAIFSIKLFTGEPYTYDNGEDTYSRFKIKVVLNLNAIGSVTVFNENPYALTISNEKPVNLFIKDFSFFETEPGELPFTGFEVSINAINNEATSSLMTAADLQVLISKLRLDFSYTIRYKIDVHGLPLPSTPVISSLNGRTAVFDWSENNMRYPGYEFQLLRLYNNDKSLTNDMALIKTDVDWSKAISILTESSASSLELTLAEGTGFYVARVRGIGTFHDGGVANDKNYGTWSNNSSNTSGLSLDRTSLTGAYFFFTDPDDEKNWIYSRTFSEGNKKSEKITFATGLLQVKQTQTFLPSRSITLMNQTVLDKSGRPALSTMSIPVTGRKGLAYMQNFVKDLTNSLYTSEHFDKSSNYRNPSPVLQTATAFSYFSDANPDLSVPGAQGYPFSRTLFYNEGKGRIFEQSGFGATHAISSAQTNSSGRTVKTFYSTPSATEIIKLFGDETPDNESILKTVTVDQNNVANITYTADDKVIATGVYILDNGTSSLANLTSGPAPTPYSVTDKVTKNIKTDSGFVSSKRLTILTSTNLGVDYSIGCDDVNAGCANLTLDCKRTLEIVVQNITDPTWLIETFSDPLTGSCVNGVKTISFRISKPLTPGTYIIEKKLIQTSTPAVGVSVAADSIESQVKPLSDLISRWLGDVDCLTELQAFYDSLKELRNNVGALSKTSFNARYAPQGLSDFNLVHGTHKITLKPDDNNPVTAIIKSPCCELDVSVAWIPPLRCPDSFTANPNAQVNQDYFNHPENSEFLPDFEGYALAFFSTTECEGLYRGWCDDQLTPEIEICPRYILYGRQRMGPSDECMMDDEGEDTWDIWPGLEGWGEGEFNWMVYHMLTDQYECKDEFSPTGTDGSSDPTSTSTDPCANPQSTAGSRVNCTGNRCTQYTCDELLRCWQAVLMRVKNELCQWVSQDNNSTISGAVDEENNDDKGKHDDHFDENKESTNFLLGLYVDFVVSKKVRDAQKKPVKLRPPPSQGYMGHMVKEFLDCTGYRFAGILTTRNDVFPEDLSTAMRPYNESDCFTRNPPMDPNTDKPYFPGIKDPVFAFKYFTYTRGSNPVLEAISCFRNPNKCETVIEGVTVEEDCCADESDKNCNFCGIGKIKCTTTEKDWSCGQRYTFFEMLRTYHEPDSLPTELTQRNCDEFYATVPGQAITLIEDGLTGLKNGCENICALRRSEIRDTLRSVLERKCYTIGGCRTSDPTTSHIVPDEDLELMVDQLVTQCKDQCNITTYACKPRQQCRSLSFPKNVKGYDIQYTALEFGVGNQPTDNCALDSRAGQGIFKCTADSLSYCEATLRKQAMEWALELDIVSKCNGIRDTTDSLLFKTIGNNTCVEKEKLQYRSSDAFNAREIEPVEPVISNAKKLTITISPPAND